MSYRVRIESFEGPFDLLLYLVSKQKVDIGSISLAEITDQYLAEVKRMQSLDLDVASDFLLVASTLLELKAASLLPRDDDQSEQPEFEDLEPNELREQLIAHLIEYKTYKNAARSLQSRFEAQGRSHARPFGPDVQFLNLMPDYLEGVSLDDLGRRCARCFARKDVFLLESEHIARRVIPVETQVETIYNQVQKNKRMRFSDFVDNETDPHVVVVTFLALLELFKRSMVRLSQDELFGDIAIAYIEESEPLVLKDEVFDSVTHQD